jgi:hypothetical protein
MITSPETILRGSGCDPHDRPAGDAKRHGDDVILPLHGVFRMLLNRSAFVTGVLNRMPVCCMRL